jgi:hypothetical protein
MEEVGIPRTSDISDYKHDILFDVVKLSKLTHVLVQIAIMPLPTTGT